MGSYIGVGEVKKPRLDPGEKRSLMSFNVIELKRNAQAVVLLCLEKRRRERSLSGKGKEEDSW